MKRFLGCAAALIVVLALVTGAILWLQQQKPVTTSFALSDGSVVTFETATFGTNHVAPLGPKYVRLLPGFLARLFNAPRRPTAFTTESHSLVLWFNHRGGAGMNSDSYLCSLVHDDGTESDFGQGRFFGSWTTTNSVEGVATAYPLREKTLRVRFYDRKNYSSLTLLGEFSLRNPKISHAARASAPPLPQTAHDGDLDVTLVSLEAAAPHTSGNQMNSFNRWGRARFQVAEKSEPSTNWTVQNMVATDSTDNRLVSNSWSGNAENGMENFSCQPALWPSETYKLRYEFSRKPEAVFSTNELWTIRGIVVPASGFTFVNTQINIGEFNVLFQGLDKDGASTPWHSMSTPPCLTFSVSPAPKNYRFTLVRVTDEKGRKVDFSGFSQSDTNWGFGLRLTNVVASIDVTVALHRSRFVEFQAQPAKWDEKFSR